MRRGVLIAIEGIDGAGKTSVAMELVKRLRQRGVEAIYTREPLESKFIEALRSVVTRVQRFRAYIASMAMLADRAMHVELVIEPLLQRGFVVVCDRYKYSTIAYQGAMGMDLDTLMQLSRPFPDPDIAIYLRVSIATALKRVMQRAGRLSDLFERKEFLERVASIYDLLARQGLLKVVNAEKPLTEVVNECYSIIEQFIRSRKIFEPVNAT